MNLPCVKSAQSSIGGKDQKKPISEQKTRIFVKECVYFVKLAQ